MKRSAYLTLSKIDSDESLKITKDILTKSEISEINDLFVLAILKNLKSIAKQSNASDKAKVMKILIELLQHKSNSVLFEIAYSLLDISSNTAIIKHAVVVLSNLLINLNDNNTTLIIIKKLNSLKQKYKQVLEENVVTYTTILYKTDLTQNIRTLLLEMITDLVNENNIIPVFRFLKQQYSTLKSTNDAFLDFKFKILESMFKGIKKYPKIEREFVMFLIEKSFSVINTKERNYKDEQSSFIREIFFTFKNNCSDIYEVTLKNFEDIISNEILMTALFVLSEYSLDQTNLLKKAFEVIVKNIGDLDLFLVEADSSINTNGNSNSLDSLSNATKTITKTVILKDGSYGTESIVVNLAEFNKKEKSFLRENLLNSNYFFACSLAVSLSKIYFRLINSDQFVKEDFNDYYFKTINVICALLKMESHKVYKDKSNMERINLCLELIIENNYSDFMVLVGEANQAYESNYLLQNSNDNNNNNQVNNISNASNNFNYKDGKIQRPGTFISFRQVTPYDAENLGFIEEDADDENNKLEEELEQLLCNENENEKQNNNKKQFVEVLTGSEDPLSVEAIIEIYTFDIMIEFYVKNRSKQDLQNISIELFAPSNLEIIEKAPLFSLKSGEVSKSRSCIKFSQSCNSFIFGEVSFSNYRGTVSSINLSGVFINLSDTYAAACTESNFRKCWMSYSWEHKTLIISKSKSFKGLIEEITSSLNMKLVVPRDINTIDEDSAFLVANLYTKSKLGEDALVNISVEKVSDKKIIGSAVIRSKIKEFAQFQGEKIKSLIK